jgi:hypothetical protein
MSVYMGFEGETSFGMGLRIDILSKTGRILSKIQLYYQNRFLAVMGATGSELD